jgi:hypothetical protein
MRLVGRRGRVVLLALAAAGGACAHGKGAESGAVGAGRYSVESIRSRATLNGQEQLLEISETGSKVVDGSGVEHMLTERGALLLATGGACRLALAVSVDGDEPGVSDRSCTWSIDGDQFLLGDGRSDLRTVYRVRRSEGRLVLEGLVDVAPDGRVIGDAAGERIVLVEASAKAPEQRRASRSAEPTSATERLHPDDI